MAVCCVLILFANLSVCCMQVDVKEIACLNCPQCRHYRYRQCENVDFCGHLIRRRMRLKSNGSDQVAETRHCTAIQDAGRERAARVQPGMVVGSECANEGEPYIVSLALTAEAEWVGPDGESWMGKVSAGEKYVRCRKFRVGPTDCMYSSTDLEFNLHSEDVRFVDMQHKEVEQRRSPRRGVVSNSKVYNLEKTEIETLKGRCWKPLSKE